MKIYYFDASQSGMGNAPPNTLANIDSSYSVTVDSSTDTISLNNAPEPSVQFITGQRYLFTQDDVTNANYKITFPEFDFATNTWLDSTRGVTPHGVPGRAHSYMLFQDDTNDANLRNYCLVDSQGIRKTTMTPPTITVTDICFNGFPNWYGGIETTVTFQNLYGTADVVLYDSNGDVVVPTSPSSLTLSYGTSTLAIVLGNDAPSGHILIGGTYTEDVSYNYNAVSQKFVVTVEQYESSPTYFIDNAYNTFISTISTNTYIFDLSFDTATYTFAFATDFDASGGTEYTANQSQVGSFLVLESAPSSQLYYYNPSTPNMGNQPKSWVTRTSGASMIGGWYNDYYGHAVACSSDGDTIIIGAYGADYGGTEFQNNRGSSYMFEWDDVTSEWKTKGSRIDGTINNETTGFAVSMSSDGNLIAIGGYEYADAKGRVRMFEWIDASGEWYQKGSDIIGLYGQNRIGKAVALSGSGTVVAIGTDNGKNANDTVTGTVSIFEWIDASGDWYQRGSNIDGLIQGDGFGLALAISHDGNTVAIGAPYVDDRTNSDGRGYVYGWEYRNSGKWDSMYQTSNRYFMSAAQMGTSVSLSQDGNIFAISGPNAQSIENNNVPFGLVQVFERNTSTDAWTQVGNNIINTNLRQVGYRVKLSANGLILVASGNDGYFQVMTYTNGDWEMQEDEIRLTTTGGHQISVDMSSDGTKVIAGYSKDGTYDTGKAVPYIYA